MSEKLKPGLSNSLSKKSCLAQANINKKTRLEMIDNDLLLAFSASEDSTPKLPITKSHAVSANSAGADIYSKNVSLDKRKLPVTDINTEKSAPVAKKRVLDTNSQEKTISSCNELQATELGIPCDKNDSKKTTVGQKIFVPRQRMYGRSIFYRATTSDTLKECINQYFKRQSEFKIVYNKKAKEFTKKIRGTRNIFMIARRDLRNDKGKCGPYFEDACARLSEAGLSIQSLYEDCETIIKVTDPAGKLSDSVATELGFKSKTLELKFRYIARDILTLMNSFSQIFRERKRVIMKYNSKVGGKFTVVAPAVGKKSKNRMKLLMRAESRGLQSLVSDLPLSARNKQFFKREEPSNDFITNQLKPSPDPEEYAFWKKILSIQRKLLHAEDQLDLALFFLKKNNLADAKKPASIVSDVLPPIPNKLKKLHGLKEAVKTKYEATKIEDYDLCYSELEKHMNKLQKAFDKLKMNKFLNIGDGDVKKSVGSLGAKPPLNPDKESEHEVGVNKAKFTDPLPSDGINNFPGTGTKTREERYSYPDPSMEFRASAANTYSSLQPESKSGNSYSHMLQNQVSMVTEVTLLETMYWESLLSIQKELMLAEEKLTSAVSHSRMDRFFSPTKLVDPISNSLHFIRNKLKETKLLKEKIHSLTINDIQNFDSKKLEDTDCSFDELKRHFDMLQNTFDELQMHKRPRQKSNEEKSFDLEPSSRENSTMYLYQASVYGDEMNKAKSYPRKSLEHEDLRHKSKSYTNRETEEDRYNYPHAKPGGGLSKREAGEKRSNYPHTKHGDGLNTSSFTNQETGKRYNYPHTKPGDGLSKREIGGKRYNYPHTKHGDSLSNSKYNDQETGMERYNNPHTKYGDGLSNSNYTNRETGEERYSYPHIKPGDGLSKWETGGERYNYPHARHGDGSSNSNYTNREAGGERYSYPHASTELETASFSCPSVRSGAKGGNSISYTQGYQENKADNSFSQIQHDQTEEDARWPSSQQKLDYSYSHKSQGWEKGDNSYSFLSSRKDEFDSDHCRMWKTDVKKNNENVRSHSGENRFMKMKKSQEREATRDGFFYVESSGTLVNPEISYEDQFHSSYPRDYSVSSRHAKEQAENLYWGRLQVMLTKTYNLKKNLTQRHTEMNYLRKHWFQVKSEIRTFLLTIHENIEEFSEQLEKEENESELNNYRKIQNHPNAGMSLEQAQTVVSSLGQVRALIKSLKQIFVHFLDRLGPELRHSLSLNFLNY